MTRPEGLPRSRRIRKSADFRRIQRTGVSWRGRFLIVLYEANSRTEPRVGLVVSRKVGNAVVRNRVKRWLREASRRRFSMLTGVDVVLIARSRAATAGLAGLQREVQQAFAAIGAERS